MECTDCTYEPPPDGDFVECTDCTYEAPPDGEYFDCTDCTFEAPPDGEFFFEPPPDGEFYDKPPEGEFYFEPLPGDYIEGDFPDGSASPSFEGTFFFDEHGDFVFDGVPTFDGEFAPDGPDFGKEDYFPDGEFYNFFNPGDFAPDLFVDTFRPDEFKGDFGDFFLGGDFQPGEFDTLFNPDEFRPDEFGSFFTFEDFKPGDFGEFATVGDSYVDFGDHFEQFWGDRSDEAQYASQFFADFDPGEFGFVPPEDLLSELQNLDYQGFQGLDSDFVVNLFKDGLAGAEFDLNGDQWAGAFSKFDVEDIRGFDQDFIGGAVHDFAPEDFLGLPGDQAFALFESAFFGGSFDGGPPPDFDPSDFEGKLDEFGDQLGGFLGAFNQEHYEQIEDGQLVDIFSRIDFAAPDFDRNVLGGDDLGGIFGALDSESFADLSGQQILDAIGGLEAKEFGGWDPTAAFNVFDNIEFGQLVDLESLDGLVGAFGFEEYQNIEGGKLVDLIGSFAFGGPDFDLSASPLDGADIAGLIGSLDGEHLGELGGDGILDAIQYLEDKDLGLWNSGAAFDIFATIGFEEAKGLDQFEGIVGNFGTDQIEQLGDQLTELLGELDFQNNGEILQGFSFGTLGVLSLEDFQGLGAQQLVDLANTTGGDGIVGLDPGQIQNLIGNIQTDSFGDFDPSVVGGLFAGLDSDQIGGFDHETLEAALEAVGANLLGGLGDFDGIAGASTAFDELANLAGFAEGLEQDGSSVIQDGAFDIFSGNLFGSN